MSNAELPPPQDKDQSEKQVQIEKVKEAIENKKKRFAEHVNELLPSYQLGLFPFEKMNEDEKKKEFSELLKKSLRGHLGLHSVKIGNNQISFSQIDDELLNELLTVAKEELKEEFSKRVSFDEDQISVIEKDIPENEPALPAEVVKIDEIKTQQALGKIQEEGQEIFNNVRRVVGEYNSDFNAGKFSGNINKTKEGKSRRSVAIGVISVQRRDIQYSLIHRRLVDSKKMSEDETIDQEKLKAKVAEILKSYDKVFPPSLDTPVEANAALTAIQLGTGDQSLEA